MIANYIRHIIEVIAVLTHKFVYGASISYRYVAIRI
jgi:hypothetical protein